MDKPNRLRESTDNAMIGQHVKFFFDIRPKARHIRTLCAFSVRLPVILDVDLRFGYLLIVVFFISTVIYFDRTTNHTSL